jgi:hypothetical protein
MDATEASTASDVDATANDDATAADDNATAADECLITTEVEE